MLDIADLIKLGGIPLLVIAAFFYGKYVGKKLEKTKQLLEFSEREREVIRIRRNHENDINDDDMWSDITNNAN